MEEVTAGVASSDYKHAIRERLRQIRELFKITKYRLTPTGSVRVDPESVLSGGEPDEDPEHKKKRGGRGGQPGGRTGNVYALFLLEGGVPGEPVIPDADPTVIWVSVEDGTREPPFLDDRAATYLLEQNVLQINGDFRVFTDMVERWWLQYDCMAGARLPIQEVVREWFEQALIETVLGILALKDSQRWTIEDIGHALSEEALTAAVMSRYHIDQTVKRTLGTKLGSLKEKAS